MRRFLARAIFAGIFGAACATSANAADLSNGNNAASFYTTYGARMEPVVIYDDQPGVIVRTYWSMPWGNRHYFPRTGKRPKSGRLEHISARPSSRAENFSGFGRRRRDSPFLCRLLGQANSASRPYNPRNSPRIERDDLLGAVQF